MDEIDLEGYSILDYGYTRVELHEEFAKLLNEFGYDVERDCSIVMLFEEYNCPKHGFVYKPKLDWEKGEYFNEFGERRRSFKVMAGRLHPFKKYGDTKRYSAQKLEQFRLIAEAMRNKGVIGFREFNGDLKQVRHFESDLALMWLVFTLPDRVSKGLQRFIIKHPDKSKKVDELMRKSIRSTLKRFLRLYLKKHENIPISGKFKEGGLINIHLWSSGDPRKAHVHGHVCIWNAILWNGKIVRFSPYITKSWLRELRKIWAKEFFKWLNKDRFCDVELYVDPLAQEDYDSFNVYNAYTWLDVENGEFEQAGKIVHHLRYNARKTIIDLNEFFYGEIKTGELEDLEKKWFEFLIEYSNRTGNFGFMNDWRKSFGISKDKVVEMLNRLKTRHYEYCPICKRRLEYLRLVTLDEVMKRKRLLVLWYFDRRMNVEVWRRATDYMDDLPLRGYVNIFTFKCFCLQIRSMNFIKEMFKEENIKTY